MDVIKYLKTTPTTRYNTRGGRMAAQPGGYERDWRIPPADWCGLLHWCRGVRHWQSSSEHKGDA